MKEFLIVSDIHGALSAAQKIAELAPSYRYVIMLGDALYHGPRNDLPSSYNPKAVIPLLNSLKNKIVAVRGNCDAEVDQMVLSFPIMSTTALIQSGERTFIMSHGHIYNEENLPPMEDGSVFLYGHTHIPVIKEENGIVIFNPGSVSIPKGGYPASYGEYDKGCLKVLSLEDGSEIFSFALKDQS